MDELIKDHIYGRNTTEAIVRANERYRSGDKTALEDLSLKLQTLTEFYPKHIEKEDKIFFPSSSKYFSEKEDQAVLAEFWEFGREVIHQKYTEIVDGLDSQY